jgi:hypothetical protein
MMIEFSLIISKQSERIKLIGQNIGLMKKQEITELREKLDLAEKNKTKTDYADL